MYTFNIIHVGMLENDCVVLNIPKEVTSTHPHAASLGAPLQAGLNMYKDLQSTHGLAASH